MSAVLGVKRLQSLVDIVWRVYPGGDIPRVQRTEYGHGSIVGTRLYTGDFLLIDAVVRAGELEIEVHRRTTVLTWGREVMDEVPLRETARAFERASFLVGLARAER